MPTRTQNAKRKRKHRLPLLVGDGKRSFKTRLTHGEQIERRYRRLYPLSDADIAGVHRTVKHDVRRNKEGHDWTFVRFQVSVVGGLYEATFPSLFDEDEEDIKPETHWISTRAVPANDPEALRDAVDELLGKRMEGLVRGRKAWLLRMETVVLKNEPRPPTTT